MSSVEEAKSLREEGNVLYKTGELTEAIAKYRQAAKVTPQDPAPLGNISAAVFEVGKYDEVVSWAEKALQLHKQNPEDDEMSPTILKLQHRISKAKLYLHKVPKKLQLEARIKILKTLPRYRPVINKVPEYFCVGSGLLSCLYDRGADVAKEVELRQANYQRQKSIESSGSTGGLPAHAAGAPVSFFLIGVGDGRDLWRSIIGIMEVEMTTTKSYHFTINEINKCALVRNLLVFMLFSELSELSEASDEYLEVISTIFYIFLGPMMPQFAFDILRRTINKALSALKSGEQPAKCFHLYELHFPEYLKVLTQWSSTALNLITRKQAITFGTRQVRGEAMFRGDFDELSPKCQEEKEIYLSSLALQPPKRILEKHDPTMLSLVQQYGSRPRANAPRFRDHLCKHWQINATMLDEDWCVLLNNKSDIDLGHDPFHSATHFDPKDRDKNLSNPEILFDYMQPFFASMAKSLKHLEGRLQIEVLLGDCVDVAEQLRFGLFNKINASNSIISSSTKLENRPEHFPTRFDRIHLDNVPDYLNGNLSSCLYFGPLTKKPGCIISSCCLLNAGSWPSLNSFLADYQLITDQDMLRKLTSTIVIDPKNASPTPMLLFIEYAYLGALRSFSQLLPKKAFMKWFYALFFRLALPFNVVTVDVKTVILSPVNLTIMFRLMEHLRILGYPSHWICKALTDILENKLFTTGRPPRATPMSIQAVTREHTEKRLCTAPFVPEMAVLTRIFAPLLPFAVSSPIIPKDDEIFLYTLSLPTPLQYHGNSPSRSHLALLFWDQTLLDPLSALTQDALEGNLRPFLDPGWGEVDSVYGSPAANAFRAKGCVVYDTFTIDVMTRQHRESTVSVWMSKDVVANMVRTGGPGGWKYGVYRTDTWVRVFGPRSLVGTEGEKGCSWAEVNVA